MIATSGSGRALSGTSQSKLLQIADVVTVGGDHDRSVLTKSANRTFSESSRDAVGTRPQAGSL